MKKQLTFASLSRELSPAEFPVAMLMLRGLGSREIGAEMDLTFSTIRNHRTSIFRKLDVGGQCELLSALLMPRLDAAEREFVEHPVSRRKR